jgi:hypothetical protein
MINAKTKRNGNSVMNLFSITLLLIFLPLSLYADNTDTKITFKPEFRIKRIPNEGVRIYSISQNPEKEEYLFTDFNADVVLLIYKHYELDQITSSLAKKYYISKDDSRRGVKRVINALHDWGMVIE